VINGVTYIHRDRSCWLIRAGFT